MVAPRAAGKPKRKRARKARTAAAHLSSSSSSSSSSSESSSSSDSSSDEEGDAAADHHVSFAEKPVGRQERIRRQAAQMQLDSDSDAGSESSSDSDSSDADDDESSGTSSEPEHGEEAAEAHSRRPRQLFTPPPEPLASFVEMDREDDNAPVPPTLEARFRQSMPTVAPVTSERMDEQSRLRKDAYAQMVRAKERQEAMQSATEASAMLEQMSDAQIEEKLQSFWVKSMIDAFGEELDTLRKNEASMGQSAKSSNRMPLLIDALQSGSELFSHGPRRSKGQGQSVPHLHQIDEVALLLSGEKDESA